MTLNKFIVSSDCPTGPKEILNQQKFGFLFQIGNHRELAKKIIYFNKNKRKLKKMIKKGYKSLNRFDFEKNCKKYELLINKHVL